MNYWNKERIFSVFENKLIKDGFLGSNSNLNDFQGGFTSILLNRYKKSILYVKIDFYKYYIGNGNLLPNEEIKYLQNILIKGMYGNKTILTDENKLDIENAINFSIG